MDDEEAADSDDDLPSIDSAFVKASQYTSSAKEVRASHNVGRTGSSFLLDRDSAKEVGQAERMDTHQLRKGQGSRTRLH